MNKLVVVPSNPPASAGPATKPAIYMPSLDRAVSSLSWSADGQRINFLLQDDRTNHLASVPAESASGKWCCRPRERDYPRFPIMYADNPLIAAMRCFVASKLGDEVDVPDELTI